jgi:hypothetical protein
MRRIGGCRSGSVRSVAVVAGLAAVDAAAFFSTPQPTSSSRNGSRSRPERTPARWY